MKNIFKILFAAILIGFMGSCERDDTLAVANLKSNPEIISTLSATSYVVNESNLNNTFETIIFKKPDFGLNIETENQLELAEYGTNFAKPVKLGATTSNQYIKLTFKDINDVLLKLNLTTRDHAYKVEVRVKSNIKTGATTQSYVYSTPISFTITPYIAGPIYPYTDLFLIGNATAAGWDNSKTNMDMFPLLKNKNNANQYSFTGYFKVGGFKILPVKGSWDKQYAYKSSGVLAVNDGGAENIPVATAGYYTLTIDLSAATYTFVPVTTNPSNTYNKISIIGTVNGNWDTDTDLTQSSFDPHMWYVSSASLSSGKFKFRLNHDWTTSWGVNQEFFGVTTSSNGADIPVTTTWHYNVYFNDYTGEYSLIPIF